MYAFDTMDAFIKGVLGEDACALERQHGVLYANDRQHGPAGKQWVLLFVRNDLLREQAGEADPHR